MEKLREDNFRLLLKKQHTMHHKEDLTNGIRSELLIETSYSLGKIFYFFTGPRYKFQFPGQNLKHEKRN